MKIQKQPLISVIIPSYNYSQFIGEAIQSVLSSTFQDFELIIVEDGSTDDSYEIIKRYANNDGRVFIYQHPDKANHGLAESLKLGINKSVGKWITILEADDILEPSCLEKRLILGEKSKADIIFNNIIPLDCKTEWFTAYVKRVMLILKKRFQKQISNKKSFYMPEGFFIESQIPTFSCAMFLRKNILDCDFNSPVPQWLDRWLWCQMAQCYSFAYLPEKLTHWRLHDDSYSNREKGNTKKEQIKKYFIYSHKFWKGLRKLLSENKKTSFCKRDAPRPAFFNVLYMPFYFPVAIRFLRMTKFFGFTRSIKYVIHKFSPVKK